MQFCPARMRPIKAETDCFRISFSIGEEQTFSLLRPKAYDVYLNDVAENVVRRCR
jgi:hypothetical protein